MALYISLFAVRSGFTSVIMQIYEQNMNLDSSSSDVMQLSELAYDYALLLRYNLSYGSVLNPDQLTALNNYIVNFTLQHMIDDERADYSSPLAGIFQTIDYLELQVDMLSPAMPINNKIFLRILLNEAGNVMKDVNQSLAEGGQSMSESG